MKIKRSKSIRAFITESRFWQENRFILREFRYLRWVATLAVLFVLASAFFESITVGFIASFLQGLTNPGEPPIQTGLQWFDRLVLATQAPPTQRIYRLSGILLAVVWCRAGFDYLGSLYGKKTSLKLVDRLRCRIFDQLESFDLSFYSKVNPGELLNTLRGEINLVQQTFNTLSVSIAHGSKVIAYLISMLVISWQLFLTTLIVFALISIALGSLTVRVRAASFEVPEANKAFMTNTFSFISGIRTVHASGTQTLERRRYYTTTKRVYDSQIELIKLSALVKPFTEGLGASLLVGMVIFFYGLLIARGLLTAAELLTFFFVLIRTTPLVSSLNSTRISLVAAQGSLTAVNDLLRRDNKSYFKDGIRVFSGLNRSINLESVDFSYVPGEPVLHNITLSIKRGETTALVGASGAGKTTLADLIPRFYDPTRGRILVDGVDLRELKINSLRHKMAIVSQDSFMFNNTARANIAYGVEGVTDEQIWEAARQANALEFILDLPEEFETVLGDRGTRLSGGQRQRIAIARALLRNPEILILDEATSALDSLTEQLIQESLEKLASGRTVIAIAHRLSTIADADKVVVLEQGRIVEQGTYRSLIKARGKLWDYHQTQFKVGTQA